MLSSLESRFIMNGEIPNETEIPGSSRFIPLRKELSLLQEA